MSKLNIVVGAGFSGAVIANLAADKLDEQVIVLEKKSHIAGNSYDYRDENGIMIHKYGSHIFHTNNRQVWNFVNSIVEFNRYTNSPVANYKGKLYSLPFNMNTFYQMWGVTTPQEARIKIEEQRKEALLSMREAGINEPRNLEEQAISLIGKDIYEKLIKGYTEKQWGRKCTELPAFIIRRLPVRFVFDNNYFNDNYQGIPIGGYNKLIDGLLAGIELQTGIDFFEDRFHWESIADKVVFTGKIDEFYNYQFGKLEYRTVKFEEEILDEPKIISIRHLEKVKQRFPLIGAFIVCIEEIAWNLSYVAKSACPAPGMNLEAIRSPIQTPLPKLCGLPFWNL